MPQRLLGPGGRIPAGGWLTNAEEQNGKLLKVAAALLQALNDLTAKPDEESH
jgi:hypothetical protein